MKAFVINLERNAERMAFMRGQLDRLGIPFERLNAIYGKGLSAAERRRDFARIRSFLAAGKRLSESEIGVALSHLGCYRRMIEEKLPYALVFEDDVVLLDGFTEAVKRVEAFLDVSRAQIVVFSGYGVEGAERLPVEIRRERSLWCADAYCITLPAAQLIVKANYPVRTVADSFKRWRRFFGLELYRSLPSTARQDDVRFGSENEILPKSNWLLRNLLWLADRFLLLFHR